MPAKCVRRFLLAALVTCWAPAASAQAVMSPEGWRPAGTSKGISYFSCGAARCGRDSLVSHKRLSDGPLDSAVVFRSKIEAVAAALPRNSRSGVTEARIVDLFSSDVGKAKSHTVVQALRQRAGGVQYMATSEISDGRSRLSVVSTSATEAAARANLKVFQPIALLTHYLNNPKLAPR